MTERLPSAYLFDMHAAAVYVRDTLDSSTCETFLEDRTLRFAVERALMIVGEALYQLERHHPLFAHRITEYRRIIDFRHLVVHGYYKIDPQVVWGIATTRLHVLIAETASMLRELPPAPGA